MKITKKTTIFIILVVFFVALDRFLKALCLKGFLNERFPIFGDIFGLHFTKNYYIAFSLPFSGPIMTALIGLVIAILIAYWFKTLKKTRLVNTHHQAPTMNIYALTILIIGAILNFTDRLQFGYVVDYLDLKWFTVFNLADIAITSSAALLITTSLSNSKNKGEDNGPH